MCFEMEVVMSLAVGRRVGVAKCLPKARGFLLCSPHWSHSSHSFHWASEAPALEAALT